ncbi:hypothetical protein K458DRAFT_105955 [Lentithecium fluviatile CBS 122367]|uniref:Uncharacterized protein n=1 Tax=Lentithecium fluviatile CBS 122367 TaxID=1168545 RepID=A0A6G1JJ16_9PLEO|nr:hypothetical protein K458DRAFT_105955 [Lentithecium fluviatile CBS 122367]
MATNSKYYDVEEFNNWKRKQGSAYRTPPRANFVAAANYMRNFLEGKKFNWAAMLGLAMACLGSRREMSDLHIVYDDRDFHRIKVKLEADQRVRLPKGMNSLFPSKLLLATGPKYKDAGCTDNVDIEVDLVPPGDHGTPPNDVLRHNQVMLRLNHDRRTETYKGLNMLYLVKTMIHYCNSQGLVWDPKKDMLFLCQNYGKEIEVIRSQLNARQVQENFLGTPFVSRLPPDVKRRCYHVLLGVDKEPPPSMSLTPAPPVGHRPTVSASEISARPRMPSHKSTPSLNTMQQPSSFLSPPLPGKSRKQQTTPQSAPATQTSIVAPQPQNNAANPPAERDSRSRYRHTSAPNTPNASRQVSPEVRGHYASRPRSAEGAPHQQANASRHHAQAIGIQKIAQVPRPQEIPSHASAPMPALPIGMRPQKSMPNMNGRPIGSVPVFAHGQNTTPPVPKVPVVNKQTISSVVPQHKNVSQRTEVHGGPQVMPHSNNQDMPRSSVASNGPQPKAQPLPPHTGRTVHSQLAADATGMNSSRNTYNANPHVVGPRGIFPSAPKPNQQSHRSQPPAPIQRQEVQITSSTFVFELEASAPQAVLAPQTAPPSHFIAELPAELDASQLLKQDSHSHTEPEISPSQGHPNVPFPRPAQYEDSPVSPPQEHHPASAQMPPLQNATQTRPSITHTQPALPQSLMIGSRRHSPHQSFSQSPPQPNNAPPRATNYQRYYSAPSSGSNSAQSSPKQVPVSAYKAYSGPISPPVQPDSAANKAQEQPTSLHMQASYAEAQDSPPQAQPHVDTNAHALPPAVLRAAPQTCFQPKNSPHHYQYLSSAHPPALSGPQIVKHDSHQDRYGYTANCGAAMAGAGAVATGYAAYSSHNTGRIDPHTPQGRPDQEVRYVPFDSTQIYPTAQHPPQPREHNIMRDPTTQFSLPMFEPGHQRSTSHDSQTSTTSHDSERLAMEYQADLPSFGQGYGRDETRSKHNDEKVDFT